MIMKEVDIVIRGVYRWCLLIFIVFCAAISFASAAEIDKENVLGAGSEKFISVTAEAAEIIEVSNTVRLSGGVKIEFKNMKIESEEILIDRNSNIVTASGPITLVREDLEFSGEGLEYNYETKSGSLKGGAICVKGINFQSGEIEISPEGVVMKDVKASTCSLENPDYHITAERIEMNLSGGTHERKARAKKVALYIRNKRILGWRSYSASMGAGPAAAGAWSGPEWGKWAFSAPRLRYGNYGGVRLGVSLKTQRSSGESVGFFGDYYLEEGMFPEMRVLKTVGDMDVSLRLGKRYKENTGYFRNVEPMKVWSLPDFEVDLPERNFRGSRIMYKASLELGRMREDSFERAIARMYTMVNATYLLNPGDKYGFSLIEDGRFGHYRQNEKYLAFGSGLGVETGDIEKRYASLKYMKFNQDGGSPPLLSDLVNPDDEIFGYYSMKVTNRTRLYTDMQYNLEDSKFEEIVLGAVRTYDCLRVNLKWRTKQKSLGMSVQILR
jgi:hypothetical protein